VESVVELGAVRKEGDDVIIHTTHVQIAVRVK